MLKLNDILAVFNFIQNNQDKNFPFKTAYKIASIGKAIANDMEFFKEKYANILNGELDEDEKAIAVNELLNVEVETVLPKLDIKDLESIEISPALIVSLSFLFEE